MSHFMATFVYFHMYAWMYMDSQWNLVNWTNACPYVTMQGDDLNMVPTVEESAPQCEMLPVERMTSRDYQISLIEARGPNSRGLQMLRVGLLSLDKNYVPPSVTTTVQNRNFNAQGAELNEANQLDGSTTPKGSLRIAHPLATRESQIALIESAGPNSRGVRLLRVGMAEKAKTQPPQPVQPTVSLLVDAMPHIRNSEGQNYRLYPKYGWQL